MSTIASNRVTIPPCSNNNSNNNKINSNIPLRKPPLHRTVSNPQSQSQPPSYSTKIPVNHPEVLRWKQKYEEVEQKRKAILIEKEKNIRKYNELNRKHVDLLVKNEQLETELFEKNEEFTKLTSASKNLYKEYEMLKNQYDTETGAMSKALKDASHWYKQNKELKRKTMLLMDKDTVDEGVDAGETGADSDIENLNKTIKQLSQEVAELQTEVDALKQIEFQTTEQNIKLTEELELEKEKNCVLEREFIELKKEHGQILRVSAMMKKQIQELEKLEEDQRNNAVTLRKEADSYKKERNVLAHQSTLLLQGLNGEDDDQELILLQDIEQLKRTLEEERTKHEEELALLQDKFDQLENNSQVELLEERLKLVESELQTALERAEKAENVLKTPPIPPPPPPPPPPLTLDQPPVVPLRVKRRSRVNVLELADTIGVATETAETNNNNNNNNNKKTTGINPVNDDIINAIKEGKFTLKKAKNQNKKERETTKAVSEILNILGNLRRAPKKRQSQIITDVQL